MTKLVMMKNRLIMGDNSGPATRLIPTQPPHEAAFSAAVPPKPAGRARQSRSAGTSYKVLNIDESASATSVAAALNIMRTHYTAGQRSAYAAKLSKLTPRDAGAMRRNRATPNLESLVGEPKRAPTVAMRRDRTRRNSGLYADEPDRAPTGAEAASMLGVSRDTVVNATRVQRDGAPNSEVRHAA